MLTLTAFSVLTRFLGFLYKIYLSRIMSTYELGVYSLTLSVYMVLITIVASSIPLSISKIASNNRSLNKEYNTHYSVTSSLILSTIVSIVLVIGIILAKPLLVWILGGQLGFEIIITLIPSIIFSALYSQIRGYLWGYENYFSVSMVEFIEQILRIVFCMLFVSLKIFPSPVISVGVALSIACGISTLYGYYLYFKNIFYKIFSFLFSQQYKTFKQFLRYRFLSKRFFHKFLKRIRMMSSQNRTTTAL